MSVKLACHIAYLSVFLYREIFRIELMVTSMQKHLNTFHSPQDYVLIYFGLFLWVLTFSCFSIFSEIINHFWSDFLQMLRYHTDQAWPLITQLNFILSSLGINAIVTHLRSTNYSIAHVKVVSFNQSNCCELIFCSDCQLQIFGGICRSTWVLRLINQQKTLPLQVAKTPNTVDEVGSFRCHDEDAIDLDTILTS